MGTKDPVANPYNFLACCSVNWSTSFLLLLLLIGMQLDLIRVLSNIAQIFRFHLSAFSSPTSFQCAIAGSLLNYFCIYFSNGFSSTKAIHLRDFISRSLQQEVEINSLLKNVSRPSGISSAVTRIEIENWSLIHNVSRSRQTHFENDTMSASPSIIHAYIHTYPYLQRLSSLIS